MTKTIEAFGNFKGGDDTPPKKKVVEKATEAVSHKKEAIESLVAQEFQLHSNILSEKARRPWCKILRGKLM